MNALTMAYPATGANVRVVTVDGEPRLVLADVCAALEIGNPSMVAQRLDPDALSTAEVIDSMGRAQQAKVIDEGGLYEGVRARHGRGVVPRVRGGRGLMGCFQEMCRNWSGSGCVCAVFGVEPAEVCEHGMDAASCLACEGGEG